MSDTKPGGAAGRRSTAATGWWLWPLFLCLFCQTTAVRAEEPAATNAAFDRARTCYNELNFDCALRNLAQARLEELAHGNDLKQLSVIYNLMAVSHVALGQDAQALEAFRQLLLVNPAFTLDARQVSPKILVLLEKAREEMQRFRPRREEETPKPKQEEEPPPKPAPEPIVSEPPPVPTSPYYPPAWSLSGSVSAAVLFARDARYYHPGAAFALDASWRLAGGWFLGPVLQYQFHPSKQDSGHLNVLSALAEAGYRLDGERFALRLPVALGATLYGRGSLMDEGGPSWRILPAAEFRPLPPVSVGLHFGAGGVMPVDRAAHSTYLLIGLLVGGHWP